MYIAILTTMMICILQFKNKNTGLGATKQDALGLPAIPMRPLEVISKLNALGYKFGFLFKKILISSFELTYSFKLKGLQKTLVLASTCLSFCLSLCLCLSISLSLSLLSLCLFLC